MSYINKYSGGVLIQRWTQLAEWFVCCTMRCSYAQDTAYDKAQSSEEESSRGHSKEYAQTITYSLGDPDPKVRGGLFCGPDA
jgi:hypothetical protein